MIYFLSMRREEIKRLVRRACKLENYGPLLQNQKGDARPKGSPMTLEDLGKIMDIHKKGQIWRTNDGELIRLCSRWSTRLEKDEAAWIFNLFQRNMRELYLKSQWGYNELAKQNELTAMTSRFLLVRDIQLRLIAFVHFRFVVDEERPVLYCYELQVEPDYQKKGIGTLLIQCLESLAEGTHMELLMATVFAFNGPSLAFFHKCGFRSDSSCMFGRDGAGGRDYVILSKQIKMEDNTSERRESQEKSPSVRGEGLSPI